MKLPYLQGYRDDGGRVGCIENTARRHRRGGDDGLMMMMFTTAYLRETKARKGDGEYVRLSEEEGKHEATADDCDDGEEVVRSLKGKVAISKAPDDNCTCTHTHSTTHADVTEEQHVSAHWSRGHSRILCEATEIRAEKHRQRRWEPRTPQASSLVQLWRRKCNARKYLRYHWPSERQCTDCSLLTTSRPCPTPCGHQRRRTRWTGALSQQASLARVRGG